MTSYVPNIKVPIIKNGISNIDFLDSEFINKKVILFGVPGAFTPTCSEKHLPGYIKNFDVAKKTSIESSPLKDFNSFKKKYKENLKNYD